MVEPPPHRCCVTRCGSSRPRFRAAVAGQHPHTPRGTYRPPPAPRPPTTQLLLPRRRVCSPTSSGRQPRIRRPNSPAGQCAPDSVTANSNEAEPASHCRQLRIVSLAKELIRSGVISCVNMGQCCGGRVAEWHLSRFVLRDGEIPRPNCGHDWTGRARRGSWSSKKVGRRRGRESSGATTSQPQPRAHLRRYEVHQAPPIRLWPHGGHRDTRHGRAARRW